jgi:hypothetical protein
MKHEYHEGPEAGCPIRTHLRTGGFHSAEGLNRPPPDHSYPTETREAPRRPRRTMSTPHAHQNSANQLKPNQIKHSKTWHSYPTQPSTIEVGLKSSEHTDILRPAALGEGKSRQYPIQNQ